MTSLSNIDQVLLLKTALHIAVAHRGNNTTIPCHPLHRGNLKCCFDNNGRIEDYLQNFRIRVEEAQCDPISQTRANIDHNWRGSLTSLHVFFDGTTEALEYLIKQEQFILDLNCRDVGDLSISAAQLRLMCSNSSANVRLGSLCWRGEAICQTKELFYR
jgi:hypothetical protein